MPSRLSADAGGYFCEFQLWSSLGLLTKQGNPRIACFVYVPKATDDEAIQSGVKVTVAFISALVDAMDTEKSKL